MDLLDLLWWFMKTGDWLALIVCAALGFLAGHFVPAGWWSIFVSMLISYHLFLGWLVFSAERKMEMARPLSYPAIIHLTCLMLIVLIGAARFIVPHFEVFCGGVAVLAFFERDWLFQTAKAAAPGR